MSRRTATARASGLPRAWLAALPSGTVETVAGGAALVAAAAAAVLRVAVNAPVDLPGLVVDAHDVVLAAALAVPAAAALAIGLDADDPVERVGLVSVGVFGLLAAAVPAARVPALGVIVAGGSLAVGAHLAPVVSWATARRSLVVGALLAAAAVSLGSASGLLGPPARTVGSALAMLGLAATPAFVRRARTDWLVGTAAFAGVVLVGVSAPFVTGAVALVGGGVVGLPLLVIALGVAGGTAAFAGAALRGPTLAALGVGCLLAAGVPSTAPRALAVVLGLVLLVRGRAP